MNLKSVRNVAVLMLCTLAPAAAVAAGPATIPLGAWKGTGTFVGHSQKGDGVSEPSTGLGNYETSLRIAEEELFGHNALVFDILSEGGSVLDMQKRRVQVALVKLRSLEDGSTLYAAASVKFDERSRWDEAAFRRGAKHATAVCRRQNDRIVVTIHYGVPTQDEPTTFYDRFEFVDERVRKHGSFVRAGDSGEFSVVYWDERLRSSDRAHATR